MNAIHTRRTLFLALLLPAAARAAPWHAPEMREGVDHGPMNTLPQEPFGPHDSALIKDYYAAQGAGGLPPGQPRRWAVGQPLPSDVPAEPLPPDLSVRLSPMYGFRYVRVGGDVLAIADGSRIVAAGMQVLIR